MTDVRADRATYSDLVDWVAFCANWAIEYNAPTEIARALREIADECDKTPDNRWAYDADTQTYYRVNTRETGSDGV